MPDPNFILPAGGFALQAFAPNAMVASDHYLPTHQRCRLYAIGLAQGGAFAGALPVLTLSSKSGEFDSFEVGSAEATSGLELYYYVAPNGANNQFGEDDVLKIENDGGGSDARSLRIVALFTPG